MGSATRSRRADMVVYGPGGEPQLAVEAKGLAGVSVEWAEHWRRNLLRNGGLAAFPFLLLAFPDRFYLWRQRGDADGEAPPDYSVDATPLLASVTRFVDQTSNPLSEWGLEFAVLSWLQDVVSEELTPIAGNPSLQWLADSGLYDAIRGGSIEQHIGA